VRNFNEPDGRKDYTKGNLGYLSTVAGNLQRPPWNHWRGMRRVVQVVQDGVRGREVGQRAYQTKQSNSHIQKSDLVFLRRLKNVYLQIELVDEFRSEVNESDLCNPHAKREERKRE